MDLFGNKPFKCFHGEYENIDRTSQKYRGIKAISMDDIVGTVGRCHDNSSWSTLKDTGRFRKIKQAMEKMEPLPPIKVYEVCGEYYVLDGHHRVMAGREIGKDFIDAEIYEFERARKKEGDYNSCPQKDFVDQTGLKGILLSSRDKYEQLLEHIQNYGHELQDEIQGDLSLKKIARLWYEESFLGTVKNMFTKDEKSDKTKAELYYSNHVKREKQRNDLAHKKGKQNR
ncbi:MAG: ParB/RepB/Spo0J family partition protein [Halanaerobiaceae bacterium]